MSQELQGAPPYAGGNSLRRARQDVRAVGEVTSENLVRTFAAQRHSYVVAGHPGEEPHGERTGIRAGLIRVIGELFYGTGKVRIRTHIEFVVFRSVLRRHTMDVSRFVKTSPSERNRECLQS